MELPIEIGEKISGEIIDITHQGDGVLRVDGFTVFTDKGIIGDKVEAEIVELKKSFGKAETLNILEESDKRIESKCKVSDRCGGCQLQSMKYEEQLKFKKDRIENDIERIGKLEDILIHDVIGMEEPYRYRNNVQIPVGYVDGKVAIGHYERGSHRVVDTEICVIQEEIADRVVRIIREYMVENNIRTYNRRSHDGIVRHIIVRTARDTKDTMVIIVTKGGTLPIRKEFIERLTTGVPEIKSIIHNVNNQRTNVVMGEKTTIIYGDEKIIDKIGDIEFKISAKSIFQVNTDQAEKMYDKVLEYADLKGDETVIDLYSGIGSITLHLAKAAKMVYGIEISKDAIEDAKENAELNDIENVGFFQGKAEELLPQLKDQGINADLLVVDPPRRGCEQELLDTIIEMNPEKFIYVSCNPATLARDLNYLTENGFKVVEIQPVDMFAQTTHVECIALIQREIM